LRTTTTANMSLKKALNKLKPGNHSNPASDDEGNKASPTAAGTATTSHGMPIRAQSPGATPRSSGIFSHRASGDYKRSEVASPTESRSSIDQPRHSLSGLLGRRTDSPNREQEQHRSGPASLSDGTPRPPHRQPQSHWHPLEQQPPPIRLALYPQPHPCSQGEVAHWW
jgi:hypothetical protein